jgi:ketosteroid isomerase-like protein
VSSSNVELVRAAFDAYLRGDEDAMLRPISPEIIVTQFPDQLDTRDYQGHEGFRQVMAEWIGTWDDWTIELVQAREIDGHVIATALQRGRGKASGVPIESEVTFVLTVRDAAIVRWQMFRTEQEGLDAVALEQ